MASLAEHDATAWCVAWNPTKQLLASCSSDKTVRVWSCGSDGSWSCVGKLDGFVTRTVRSVAWSPGGELLAATSFDGDTAIWRCSGGPAAGEPAESGAPASFEALASLQGHENEVKGAAWSDDGGYLATSGRDKNVWVWEAEEDGEFECAGVLTGHSQDVKTVLWLPRAADGGPQDLVSCSYDSTARVWREDPTTGDWACAQVLEGHGGTVWSAAAAPDGAALVTAGYDARLMVWTRAGADSSSSSSSSSSSADAGVDAKEWRSAGTFESGHGAACLSVAWSPSGGVVASAGADDSLRFSAIRAGSLSPLHHEEGAHDGDANCVAWCPWSMGGGRLLASCGDDGAVRVWRWSDPDTPA